jgi:hypothetical protein
MAITDHFHRAPDSGFVRSYDTQAARRQFQVSLVLILILALAAFTFGLLVRFGDLVPQANPAPSRHHELHYAGSLTDFRV